MALLLGIPALLWGVLRPDDLDEVLDAEARALRSRRAPARKRRPPPAAAAAAGARAAPERAADDEGVPQASAAVAAAPTASPAAAEQQAHAEPASSGVAVAAPAGAARAGGENGRDREPPAPRRPAEDPRERAMRLRRATAAGIGLWMLSGLVLFSHMARLHPRYVEGFTPAVAAMLGIGVAWAASPRGPLASGVPRARRSWPPCTTPSACSTGARANGGWRWPRRSRAIALALLARARARARAGGGCWPPPACSR